MKRLIFCLIIAFTAVSCAVPQSGLSVNQTKSLKKFHKRKRVRSLYSKAYLRYVSPKKRGHVNDRAINKQTRKRIVRDLNKQRLTANGY